MKQELTDFGLTTTRTMSEEDVAKWHYDFLTYGQAFTKEVDGVDVYVPYESVYKQQIEEK
jgi:hypothetical protein